eukprot:6200061-Pleurochrysis_carterae.AAC.2
MHSRITTDASVRHLRLSSQALFTIHQGRCCSFPEFSTRSRLLVFSRFHCVLCIYFTHHHLLLLLLLLAYKDTQAVAVAACIAHRRRHGDGVHGTGPAPGVLACQHSAGVIWELALPER